MGAVTLVNSRPERKQLSDQLDRMDSILDGLSSALNEAVADAAKEGVKEAVTTAVIELLTNPDLKRALHKATAPETESKPSFWSRLKAKMSHAVNRVKRVVVSAASVVVDRVAGACSAIGRLVNRARESNGVKTAIKLAIGVGALAVVVKNAASRGLGNVVHVVRGWVEAAGERVSWWGRCALYRLGMI